MNRYEGGRPYAASGNGLATFITDAAGNVVGATVVVSGNSTHLGLFSGNGEIQFIPDANDPMIRIGSWLRRLRWFTSR